MKLISWNCRGLGNPEAVRDLCQMAKEKRPTLLFLMETKSRKKKLEEIRVKLGFDGVFVVDPVGRSGGLALLWKESGWLEIQNFTRRHINAVVQFPGQGVQWTLTCFYGHPISSKRHESWELLHHLRLFSRGAWMCIGDFNEIVKQSEKSGGAVRRDGQIAQFREVLVDCGLSDLGYRGSKFTWNNGQQNGSFIKERLDRAVANKEWCGLFKNRDIWVLPSRTSDHKPLLLSTYDKTGGSVYFQKSFKFEAHWLQDEECMQIIKNAWGTCNVGATGMQAARERLSHCQSQLTRWSDKKFSHTDRVLKDKTKKLEEMQRYDEEKNWPAIKILQGEIDSILEHEDVKWKQRAKQSWYNHGDRNTSFFHAWASHRRKVNKIEKIIDEDGREWKKQHEIGEAFANFFQQLFSASNVNGVENCVAGLEARVTEDMNTSLLRNFTMVEVETALSQMHPLKSPGPDGFSACFYQNAWPTVKEEVCQAVLGFLNHDIFYADLNTTYIALIPKIKSPVRVSDYRPISLCNVLYKLISKVLANRLKKVLPIVISPTQSAFIPGRLITDNILVAFEAMHTMSGRMKGREGYMALKLDMSKAYDRVEWGFLEAVMRRLGFAERWIHLMMTCVKTVSYSVLIHGKPYGRITPTRGIRQGDPLSPYLFILCAEGLSSLLQTAEANGYISGLPITRGGTRLNHLFFADDSLLFCKANTLEWLHIQQILEMYEKASGQKLNMAKTSIFFSKNTRREVKEHILSIAGVGSTRRYEKYLGLPALVGRSRVEAFMGIKNRIWERINGWKERFLSQAGKEVLLKAVIQSIPTYTMSVFQLPKTLCKDINTMMAKFWWGHKGNDSRIAWMSWERMGKPKEKGGMGYRDLENFNLALLAKQGWRLLQNPTSLVAKIFKEKYHPGEDFLESGLGRRPSFAWRSIWNAKKLLQQGLIWRVGDGSSIHIWHDRWIPKPSTYTIQSPIRCLDNEATVKELIDADTLWWNIPLVQELFLKEEAELICSIPICPGRQRDRLVWVGTKNGVYSVKSAYHLARECSEAARGSCSDSTAESQQWKNVWHLKGPPIVKTFLWQACNEILPTRANLYRKGIISDPLCPICGLESETVGHILWSCPSASDVWAICMPTIQKCSLTEDTFANILEMMRCRLEDNQMQHWTVIARLLWLRRNKFIFENGFQTPMELSRIAQVQVESFNEAEKGRRGHRSCPISVGVQIWNKPPLGVVKLNWDAAVNVKEQKMGLGIIARDHTGQVLAVLVASRMYITDPTTAEALAAWKMAEVCVTMGFQQVHMEGDSLEVVQALSREDFTWGRYGPLINDAKLLLQHVQKWEVSHVRRTANEAAHTLAKLALTMSEERLWTEDFPSCVRNIVFDEAH
jgi:ribonuclease HI